MTDLAPTPEEFGGMGAIPLPYDERDYKPGMHPAVREILALGVPGSADRSAGSCEILNQGASSACVVFGISHGIQIDNKLDRQVCHRFAASQYYTEMGGTGANGVDTRSSLQRAVDVGAPLVGGGRIKIGSYFRCDPIQGVFADQIKAAIAANQIAVIATLLPATFGGVWKPGVVTSGYHLLCVSGYSGDIFWGPNSWGAGWGGGNGHPPGFYELSFQYVQQNNFLSGYTFAFFFDPAVSFEPNPDPTPTPTPTPSPTPPPINNNAAEVFRLVNVERQKAGLKPLAAHTGLSGAAQSHAQDMATRNFYSHNTPDGKTPRDRLTTAGLPGNIAWGENIAAGVAEPGSGPAGAPTPSACGWDTERGEWVYAGLELSPAGAMTQWMASPGHRSNILNPGFTHVGCGYGYNAASQYDHYWVQDFAALQGDNPPPPPPSQLVVSGYNTNPVKAGQVFAITGRGFAGGNLFARHGDADMQAARLSDTRIDATAPLYAATVAAPVRVRVEGAEAAGPVLTVTAGDGPPPPPPVGELDLLLATRAVGNMVSVWAQALYEGRPVTARISGGVGSTPLPEQLSTAGRAAAWRVTGRRGDTVVVVGTDEAGRTGSETKQA